LIGSGTTAKAKVDQSRLGFDAGFETLSGIFHVSWSADVGKRSESGIASQAQGITFRSVNHIHSRCPICFTVILIQVNHIHCDFDRGKHRGHSSGSHIGQGDNGTRDIYHPR
jgi:hypothetical protein